jgi:hypothetical protein
MGDERTGWIWERRVEKGFVNGECSVVFTLRRELLAPFMLWASWWLVSK